MYIAWWLLVERVRIGGTKGFSYSNSNPVKMNIFHGNSSRAGRCFLHFVWVKEVVTIHHPQVCTDNFGHYQEWTASAVLHFQSDLILKIMKFEFICK